MKISVIVITANPIHKQYAYYEALQSYAELADEVIVFDGGFETFSVPPRKTIVMHEPDPEVWGWEEHALRLNKALDAATGDWIIKVDIDWIFHENSFVEIRKRLEGLTDKPVASFQKMNFYPNMKYKQKGEVPIAINKIFKDRVRFGKDQSVYTDLTYPIWNLQGVDRKGVPIGDLVDVDYWGRTGVEFWNFDYTFKTIKRAKELFLRGSQAHENYFGKSQWGKNEDEAFDVFIKNMKHQQKVGFDIKKIGMLPKYIRERITNLKPEEFGYNGWSLL